MTRKHVPIYFLVASFGVVIIVGLCAASFGAGYFYGVGEHYGLFELLDSEPYDETYDNAPLAGEGLPPERAFAEYNDDYLDAEDELREALKAPHENARVLPSGVAILNLGDPMNGPKPKSSDLVVVDFEGWSQDGRYLDVYEDAYDREVPLSTFMEGFSEAVQTMHVGEYVRVWIPQDKAFKGQAGKPLGPLVFEIDLLEIVPNGER